MTYDINIKNEEEDVIDNVIKKLQIHMDYNKQTLFGLASKMGFSYQPFYRLFTKKHLPTINSLNMIANYFDCNISELIDDEIFLDINCYSNYNDYYKNIKQKDIIRIYINYKEYLLLLNKTFFAIQISDTIEQEAPINYYKIFYQTDSFNYDGYYLSNYDAKNIFLKIVNVSSSYVTAIIDNKEFKVTLDKIKPIAKFYNYLAPVNNNSLIKGRIK